MLSFLFGTSKRFWLVDGKDLPDRYLGAQVVVFLFGNFLHLTVISLPLVAVLAGLAWVAATRRARSIAGTPTSRIVSAAQGYAEIIGKGEALEGDVLHSPVRARSCLWYRYRVEEKKWYEKKWRLIEHGESDASFAVRDDSGLCVIDPNNAHIQTRHAEKWRDGARRYSEETLRPGDPLYVLGEFYSENPAEKVLDVKRELGVVLADWKQNQSALRARFDADGDGQIDQDEWRLARLAALQGIHAQHAQARALPATHRMCAPRDRRPFLISNMHQSRLAQKSDLSAFLHMLWFAATASAALTYLAYRFSSAS